MHYGVKTFQTRLNVKKEQAELAWPNEYKLADADEQSQCAMCGKTHSNILNLKKHKSRARMAKLVQIGSRGGAHHLQIRLD